MNTTLLNGALKARASAALEALGLDGAALEAEVGKALEGAVAALESQARRKAAAAHAAADREVDAEAAAARRANKRIPVPMAISRPLVWDLFAALAIRKVTLCAWIEEVIANLVANPPTVIGNARIEAAEPIVFAMRSGDLSALWEVTKGLEAAEQRAAGMRNTAAGEIVVPIPHYTAGDLIAGALEGAAWREVSSARSAAGRDHGLVREYQDEIRWRAARDYADAPDRPISIDWADVDRFNALLDGLVEGPQQPRHPDAPKATRHASPNPEEMDRRSREERDRRNREARAKEHQRVVDLIA